MTIRLVLAAALAFFIGAPQARNVPPLQAGDIVITGGQLFDSIAGRLTPNTGIVVRHGIFLEVGTDLSGRDLGAAQVIRLAGTDTVLPGLFDLHAHYAIDLFGEGRVDEYTVNPVIFLANGVTSTFPGGEIEPEGMLAARRRMERGEQIGARLHSGTVLRHGSPGLAQQRVDTRARAGGSRHLGGPRREGLQGQGHPAGPPRGAHRPGAQVRPARHGPSRLGRAELGQSA